MQALRRDMIGELVLRYGWTKDRAKLFLMLLDALSKEYCMNSCDTDIDSSIFDEIRHIFAI